MATPLKFSTPVDVANRALQLCGSNRIVAFTDNSVEAQEVAFVYDKLREAELRRNIWRFATRKAVLYPINQPPLPTVQPTAPQTLPASLPTMLLVPPTWSATDAYDFGAIVQDSSGNIWQSTVDQNVGLVPGVDPSWDTYFGSMNVTPYDISGSTAYNAGDLTYIANEDGSNQVYLSRMSANKDNPSSATLWGNTTAYQKGSVVFDGQYYWQSTIEINQNNQPGFYFPWSNTVTYEQGVLVSGTDSNVYTSVSAGNIGHNPVTDGGVHWTATGSKIGSYQLWNSTTTYAQNTVVAGIDGNLYLSLINGNIGNNPLTAVPPPKNNPTNGTWVPTGGINPWTSAFATTTATTDWLALEAGITDLNILYPLGSGPSLQSETRNIFQLPNGYLREAPQDPKRGSTSYLGAPSGLPYNDWEYEGNYLVSRTFTPINYRFIADITVVSKMDPMFCEMLAARIAEGICEKLTQSTNKLREIGTHYKVFKEEAITVNGIETGPSEPPEDDYVTCRI